MPYTFGKDASVKIGSTTMTFMNSWNLEMSPTMVDITQFGDQSPVQVPAQKTWTGSVSGIFDRTDTQQAALLSQLEDGGTVSTVDLRLYTGASSYWYGSAYISGISVAANVAETITASFNFTSAGAMAYSS